MEAAALVANMRGTAARQAKDEAKRLEWQARKTKANAFFLFALATAVLVYVMWAGVKGGG